MATATKESRAASQLARHALNVLRAGLDAVGMFEDNGGACRWMLSPGDGPILARSESFTSYDDAERSARRVRDGAASARFDRRAGEFTPVDLGARRDGPSDDLDAERWLDEAGSFSSEAVLT
jgi:uncharacterized protein YegP (UPF0339 family)